MQPGPVALQTGPKVDVHPIWVLTRREGSGLRVCSQTKRGAQKEGEKTRCFRLHNHSLERRSSIASAAELSDRFASAGKVRQAHLRILAREDYALGSSLKCGRRRFVDIRRFGLLIATGGGDVDIDAGIDFAFALNVL